MKKRMISKMLSWLLILGLVLGGAPMSQLPVYATEEAANSSGETFDGLGEIIAYEDLASEIAVQNVPLGTAESELNLPSTLMAKVRMPLAKESLPLEVASSVTGSAIAVPSEAEQNQEPGEQNEELDIPVPVVWKASPAYDGDTAGKYLFTANAEGFTVSAEPPVITITVGSIVTKGLITAFGELPEEIRWQNTMAPEFPEMVEGIVDGKRSCRRSGRMCDWQR